MRDRYEEQDDEQLKRLVIQLTHAANAYIGELLYGKDYTIWGETREHLVDTMIAVLRRIGLTEYDIHTIVSEQVEFETWWENRRHA